MKPASILVTDDERNIRMMIRTTLEADGYLVEEAANGREALEMLRQTAPDVMLLDLNMPEMDGMAVLEHMKSLPANSSKPKVVVLTAYGSIPAAVKATRLGAVDFLEKPITPEELRQTIKSVLTEPDPQPAMPEAIGQDHYQHVVDRIRTSLRLAEFTNAEALLSKVAERKEMSSAEYYNLLGVLYESQHKWRLARKCYGKAIAASRHYQPAQMNMRRIYELYTFGRSSQPVMLGDESQEMSLRQLREMSN